MMPKFKGKTKPKLHKPSMETVMRWMITLLLGFVVLLPVFAGVTQYEQNKAKADVEEVLAFMQTSCRKYDNYRLANTTEALQDVLTKVKTLTVYRYEEEDALLNENRLQRYAKFQYLTGIFVLDENFSVLAHYDKAGKDESLLLSQIIGDKNAADILNYPQKTYADQICLNDNTYNYAISARQDKPGLVICYTDVTRFQNDKNELSLSTMLDAEMFRQDVTVVITDGMRVISTNCEQLENILVQYYPIADVLVGGEQLTPDTLLQLKNDSGTWYGMFTQYRDYYLYAFFPSHVVYASRRGWMLLFTAIYLFCGMGYLIWRQYSKKRRLLRMEKEYHLVSAISSIYLSNLLIHPQDDTWEPIVQSERMKAVTNGILSAKAMLEKFNTECVAEAYREEFRAFTDLDTAQQRLEGKAFDGFTMENVEGKWYQLLLVPQRRFTHREKPSSFMLLFRDVSKQKERDMEYQENLRRAAEEATLANAAKTDFLRRMSHDIRTPINGIRGMVQIADRFPNDAKKQAECRAKIMRSSDFLLDLVNDVLDMSKLESGEMQLEEVPFNLNELLHDVGTLLSTQAQARGITCTLTMEDKREKHVIGSPLHLRRIFQNIGGNAIKYGRAGGYVHATCSIVSQTENTVRYRFICEDNGCGMSEEFQKHMFEPFSQENSGARTTYQGTGLGLSIVKKLVDAMGGTVTVVSEKGVGTTFITEIPLKLDPAASDAEKPEEEIDTTVFRGLHVLLVEDNEVNMEIAAFLLEDSGAEVTKAWNGAEGLEKFKASAPGTYDLILMDIMMPVMNGLEAAEKIRALDRPDSETVPIFAMTANAFSDDAARSRKAGMNEHLTKPLDLEKITKAVRKYCKKNSR